MSNHDKDAARILPAVAGAPLDAYKIVRRIRCGCGQVHVEDCKYDHKYTPMHCMCCGKALNLDLLTHHHEREYLCPDHCREHVWKAAQHWPSHCQCCSMDELTFRRDQVEALNEQVQNLQRHLQRIEDAQQHTRA